MLHRLAVSFSRWVPGDESGDEIKCKKQERISQLRVPRVMRDAQGLLKSFFYSERGVKHVRHSPPPRNNAGEVASSSAAAKATANYKVTHLYYSNSNRLGTFWYPAIHKLVFCQLDGTYEVWSVEVVAVRQLSKIVAYAACRCIGDQWPELANDLADTSVRHVNVHFLRHGADLPV